MNVKACICTDVGQSRSVNQDAALIKVARTSGHGRISLMAVCDGMGGLSKGEIASCKVIRALETWFMEELYLLLNMDSEKLWDAIESSMRRLIIRCSRELGRYGKHRGIQLGTTMAAFLQIGNKFLLVNVGDSRIYAVDRKSICQLTTDQSVRQNVLLQCIGSGKSPEPEIKKGIIDRDTTYVACSDGFWKTLDLESLRTKLCPQMCITDEDMLSLCRKLSDEAIEKGEDDNITAAAMCLEF